MRKYTWRNNKINNTKAKFATAADISFLYQFQLYVDPF